MISQSCDGRRIKVPSLHILGTGCNTGDQIVFEKTTIMRQSIDELQADAAASTSHATISKTNCPVSSAIAASAAFPPMSCPFASRRIVSTLTPSRIVAEFGEVEVADGGIIDNTGLAFSLCQGWGRDRTSILVSDAGKPFDWSTESLSEDSVASWFNRMDSAVSHIYRQCDRLMMHPSSRCHKVSISNSSHFKAREKVIDEYNHALDRAVALRVKDIQTDLDSLSRSEAFSLVRMGYDLAGARLSAAYPVRIRKDNFFKACGECRAKGGSNSSRCSRRFNFCKTTGTRQSIYFVQFSSAKKLADVGISNCVAIVGRGNVVDSLAFEANCISHER